SLPQAVAVGDFNGDGFPDLVTANSGSNTASVLLNAADWPPGPSPTRHRQAPGGGGTDLAHVPAAAPGQAATPAARPPSRGPAPPPGPRPPPPPPPPPRPGGPPPRPGRGRPAPGGGRAGPVVRGRTRGGRAPAPPPPPARGGGEGGGGAAPAVGARRDRDW